MKTTKEKQELLEILRRTPIVQTACQKVGTSRATFYRWKKENKTFSQQADKAILEGSKFINDMAESQLISAIKDKNLTAIIFWLKHHHNKYETRVNVMAELKESNPLTKEQEELIKQALQLAALESNATNNIKLINKENVK